MAVGELGEGPAAVGAEAVDAGDPIGFDGRFLGFGVFAAVAFDLDDEVERVFVAGNVAYRGEADDEVGRYLRVPEPNW